MRFEIDMQPPRAALARNLRCHFDETACYSLPAEFRGDAGVKYEGMDAAIPGYIDKTDQTLSGKCADMSETSRQDRREIPSGGFVPSRGPQGVERLVVGIGIGPEFNRHNHFPLLIVGEALIPSLSARSEDATVAYD